jgi:PAS domain S-box-containing protein
LSLKRRFIASCALALLVTLSLGGYALSVNRDQEASLSWAEEMFGAYEALNNAQTEFTNARRGARTYLLYGDPEGIHQYEQSKTSYLDDLEIARSVFDSLDGIDPSLIDRLHAVEQAIADWNQFDAVPSIALRRDWTGSDAELQSAALAWAQSPEIQPYFNAVNAAFTSALEATKVSLADRIATIGDQNSKLTWTLISTLVAMTAFALIAAVSLYRDIARPLDKLAKAALGIRAGDLSRRSGVAGSNEIGSTAIAFDSMADQVQQLVLSLESAQRELAEREARLRVILSSVGDAILTVAPDGSILEANEAAGALFAPGQGLAGTSVDRFIAKDEDMNVGGDFSELSTGPRQRQLTARTVAGEPVEVEINASRALIQGRWHVLLCIRDVSVRAKAEAERQAQHRETERARQLARSVIDAATDVMIYIDLDGRVSMVNERHAARFGIPDEEVIGTAIDALADTYRRVFAETGELEVALATPFEPDEEFRVVRLEQTWPVEREFTTTVLPVLGPRGDLSGKLAVMRDVSAERAADRMKSDFVALVSHELRTPLTSVKGYVELILEDEFGPVPDEQRGILGIISDSAQRLVLLTNDLLDISKIEAGRLDLRPAPMEVSAQIRSVLAALRPQIENKRQRLVLDLPETLPLVFADQNRFIQVLTNLVSNAHKYTGENGTITVGARQTEDRLLVEVTDTGVGLSEDEQSRLFTRFYRVQNRATRKESGTGLGLAIAKSLVEAQNGEIGVRSLPGEGSTFYFTVPVVLSTPELSTHGSGELPETAQETRPRLTGDAFSAETASPRPDDLTVLIADDDAGINQLLRARLRRPGIRLLTAGNGAEALELLEKQPIDMVILDISMPVVDGLQVLDTIRARGLDTAVVMSTAFGSEQMAMDALRRGANDFVRKPYEAVELSAVMDRTIERIRLKRQNERLLALLNEREPTASPS